MTDLIDREAVLAILRGQRDASIETSDTYGDKDELDEDEDEIYANALDVLIRQFEKLPAIKPQVVANISGGLLQGASSDYAVDLYTLDFDTDSFDHDTTGVIIDGDEAYLGQSSTEIDPEFVRSVIEAETVFFHNGATVCGQCDGEGKTLSASNMQPEPCPVCDGTGELPDAE